MKPMPIEEQVVSLELAKGLKKAGYVQEGVWWWHIYKDDKFCANQVNLMREKPIDSGLANDYVAPTVAELGERLPYGIRIGERINRIICRKPDSLSSAVVELVNPDGAIYIQLCAVIEADARAKMWLYLKKEGLL